MAKVDKNKLIQSFRGAIGGLVFRQMPDGSVVVSAAPHYGGRKRKSSKRQKEHQLRFKEAASYARRAANVHPIYAELARGTVKSAYNFALSDWFSSPIIYQVQRMEGRVLVQASDNILVTRVQVKLLDEEGRVLETGEGIRQAGDWWEYVPTEKAGQTITAEAWDLAGNAATLTLQDR